MIRKSNQPVDPRCGQEVKGAVGKKGNASAKSGSRFDLLEGVDPQVHEGNTSGAQMARQLDLLSRTLLFFFIIHLKSIGFLSMGRDPVGGSSHLYQCSDSLARSALSISFLRGWTFFVSAVFHIRIMLAYLAPGRID